MSDISDQGILPPYIDSPRQDSPEPAEGSSVPDEDDAVDDDQPQTPPEDSDGPAVPIEPIEDHDGR